MNITELFCDVDDFCQQHSWIWRFENAILLNSSGNSKKRRRRQTRLSESELCTILIAFHIKGYRNFKAFYLDFVFPHWKGHFPQLVSYNRFVELKKRVLLPLSYYLKSKMGRCTGLSFIDSTKLSVCHNLRIRSHRVFDGVARQGRTSTGWFFGFKLHIVTNEQGELLSFKLTPGNIHDLKPVPDLTKELFGRIYGDKGYISKALFEQLFEQGLTLVTRLRKNMKNKLIPMFDKMMLRKRAVIESVIDQMKNISQVEHSRHRSPENFLINILGGLIAYCLKPKKPSLNIEVAYGSNDIVVF